MSSTKTSIIITSVASSSPNYDSIITTTLKSPEIIKKYKNDNDDNSNNTDNNNINNKKHKSDKQLQPSPQQQSQIISTNGILFSKLLSNEKIKIKIFREVKRLNSKLISRKYQDILSLEWMINYKHWGLIKDKIQQGFNLIISSVCRKIIFSIPDITIFKMCFERYQEYFPKLYPSLIDHAAYYGNYEMVVYLHKMGYTATPSAIDNACRHVNGLAIVKFLKENRSEGCTDSAMENAVSFNDFELVKYIHQQLNEPCTLFAIDHASSNGNLEILQYLHKNLGNNGFTNSNNNSLNNSNGSLNSSRDGNNSSSNGSLNINLNSSGGGLPISSTPPLTPKRSKALDLAAQYGHLDCLKYLIQHNIIPPSAGVKEVMYSPRGGRSSNAVVLAPDSQFENPLYSATKQAIGGGHLEIVKYLFTLYQPNNIEVFILSITKGQLEILEFYMNANLSGVDYENYFRINYKEDYIANALVYKNLELIRVCHARLGIEITSKAFDIAVRFVDRPDLLAYLLQEKPTPDGGFNSNLLSDCCIYNNLAAIKALCIFGGESFYLQPQAFSLGMEIASSSGFLEIVQCLNELDQSLSIGIAIDKAAINGHLSIVKYLTENRPNAHCTTDAIDKAVFNGHEDVVCYLLKHRQEGSTSRAISNASLLGDLDMVMFLHQSGQPCSKAAINNAALNGNLPIIQYLQKNRTEGCSEQALINAITGTCFDTVKFIIDNYCPRDIQITESTMIAIGEAGDLNILKYFKDTVSRTVSVNLDFSHVLKPAFNYGYLDIIKYCLQPSGPTTPRTPTSNSLQQYHHHHHQNIHRHSGASLPPLIFSPISSSSTSPLQLSPPSSPSSISIVNSSSDNVSPSKSLTSSTSSSNTASVSPPSSPLHLSIGSMSTINNITSPLSFPLTKELISISYSRSHSHILEHLLEYHPKALSKYLSTIDLSPRKRILKYDEYHLLVYLKNVNSRINSSKNKPTISLFSKILPIKNLNFSKLNK